MLFGVKTIFSNQIFPMWCKKTVQRVALDARKAIKWKTNENWNLNISQTKATDGALSK